MSHETYRAAVIGLGNIGFQFSLDRKRKGISSHVSAYDKSPRTTLVGVADSDPEKIAIFKKYYKQVPAFETARDLMESGKIDVVSICTPPSSHYAILKSLVPYPLKAIFCEKPLSETLEEGKEMIQICDARNIILAVNYIRRWNDTCLLAGKMLSEGKIGNIKILNAIYGGEIFNIGTHLLDLIFMLIKRKPIYVSGFSPNIAAADPDISGSILFEDDIFCSVLATGKKKNMIFEVDIIGDEGRIRILESGDRIEWFVPKESPGYSGYSEFFSAPPPEIQREDRFLKTIRNMVSAMDKKEPVRCSGADALKALSLSLALLNSAKEKGAVMTEIGN